MSLADNIQEILDCSIFRRTTQPSDGNWNQGATSAFTGASLFELCSYQKQIPISYLARHEKRARRWRYGRYVTLCFVCLLYFNGFYGFLPAYNDGMTSLDEAAYIKQLGNEPIPADNVLARHWLAGYANKIAVIGALERKSQSANLLLGIVGAIMLTVALIGTILLVNHWNDGERDIVMVKFIRGYVQKQTE